MIAIIVVGVLLLYYIAVYNNLTRKKNQVSNAFGSIDAMLKKRYDLLPNLVVTVQQYTKHEAETLNSLTALRTKAYATMTTEEKTTFDQAFSQACRNFLMVAENYPDLKASANFIQLQRTLNETEEQLAASRRTYNACVTDYNNAVMTFPSNIVANIPNFKTKEILTTPEEERSVPNLKNLFNA